MKEWIDVKFPAECLFWVTSFYSGESNADKLSQFGHLREIKPFLSDGWRLTGESTKPDTNLGLWLIGAPLN